MRRNLLARSLTIVCATAAVFGTACICQASGGPSHPQEEAPRGMVEIPGGTVLLGSTAEELQKLAARISDEDLISYMVAEYPQHEVRVDPFYIGLTEVTNRQWKAFLDATGHDAPHHYYLVPVKGEKEEAAPSPNGDAATNGSSGKRDEAPAKVSDDKGDKQDKKEPEVVGVWKRWENGEIPKDDKGRPLDDHPVTGITYNDVQDFCRWSGMRLPTEAEWELAAKGPNSDRRFPWKGDWDPTLCQNVEKPPRTDDWVPDGTWPVGFNEKNKSVPYGLYDMAGNVWEFTSSPFKLYEGNKPVEFKIKGKKTLIHPPSGQELQGRVVKGGSFGNPMMAQRTSARFGMLSTDWVDAVGFRTARSPEIGLDIAKASHRSDFLNGYEEELDFERIRGAERFHWDGDIQTGHEAFVFVPRKAMEDIANDNALARKAKADVDEKDEEDKSDDEIENLRETVLLGMIVSKLDFQERELSGGQKLPKLSAGAYLLRYVEPRSDFGDPDTEEGDDEEEDEEKVDQPDFVSMERGEPYIVFEDPRGKIVAAIKLEEPIGKNKKRLDSFKLEPSKGLVTIETHFMIGRSRSRKPAEFTVQLACEPEQIAGDWMMSPTPK